MFARWERGLLLRHSVSAVLKYLVSVLLVSHWIACLFFYVGVQEYRDGRDSWVEINNLVGVPLAEGGATLSDQYVHSLYLSLTLATTTGFGDISAESSGERVVACIGMVIGTGMFSFGLTSVLVIFQSMDTERVQFRERIDRLNKYLALRGLPPRLKAEVRQFFFEKSGEQQWLDLLAEERRLMMELSPSLRTKLVLMVNKDIIRRVSFFMDATPRFATELLLSMSAEFYAPGEAIAKEGDAADRLWIVVKGQVALCKKSSSSSSSRASGSRGRDGSSSRNGPRGAGKSLPWGSAAGGHGRRKRASTHSEWHISSGEASSDADARAAVRPLTTAISFTAGQGGAGGYAEAADLQAMKSPVMVRAGSSATSAATGETEGKEGVQTRETKEEEGGGGGGGGDGVQLIPAPATSPADSDSKPSGQAQPSSTPTGPHGRTRVPRSAPPASSRPPTDL